MGARWEGAIGVAVGFFLCPIAICCVASRRMTVRMQAGLAFGIMLMVMYQGIRIMFFLDRELLSH